MKVFIIDVSHCPGCYACQFVCKDEHCGNDWTPYAKPQPDTGQFWIKINEYIRGTIPKVKMTYIPVLCMHCDNAPCIKACPNGAMYKRPDGLVIIDPKKCAGCQSCIDACPYGCIYYNENLSLAQKCTGCSHLLDKGWSEPRCADVCANGAIKFGEESDLKDLIAKSEVLHPEYGTKPRVYYMGLPKRFIAGTVYDPSKKEIIEDAICLLTGEGIELTTKTDGFGDFWFEDIDVGTYSLKIESDGKIKVINSISTERDVNLGDIPLA